LLAAPHGQWQGAACSYGLVLEVLSLSERALRQSGLHTSAGQLEALAREFRRQRRSPLLMGDLPPQRQRQIDALPVREPRQRRRRLPRIKPQ
jgi:hypothetical protein